MRFITRTVAEAPTPAVPPIARAAARPRVRKLLDAETSTVCALSAAICRLIEPKAFWLMAASASEADFTESANPAYAK